MLSIANRNVQHPEQETPRVAMLNGPPQNKALMRTPLILSVPTEWGAALGQASSLADTGAASPGASDHQKWALGDAIGNMQDALKELERIILDPGVAVTAEAKVALREYRTRYNHFLHGQCVKRGTLVDYASVARVFPPGDSLRTTLSFSHGRALSRVRSAEGRAAWIAHTLEKNLSVRRLQFELNAAPSGAVPTSVTPPSGALESIAGGGSARLRAAGSGAEVSAGAKGPKSQHTLICAQTGRPITDLHRMVEIRLYLDPASGVPRPRKPRGGAARAANSGSANFPDIFRFEDRAALGAWLEATGSAHMPAEPLPQDFSEVSGKDHSTGQIIMSRALREALVKKSPAGSPSERPMDRRTGKEQQG